MPLFTLIAETLRNEITTGQYPPGAKLPTEAALAERFGVNRHTVRHALQALADAGLVYARRGSGVFVRARPMDYPLGRRVRFIQNISASGKTPSRRISRVETLPASAEDIAALALTEGEAVHVVEGVSLADGQPVAAFRSVFPAGRFPTLPVAIAACGSITQALADCGLTDYTRAQTRLTALLADPLLALTIQVAVKSAVLQSVAINVDTAGLPVEHGTTWFAGDRVTLTVNPD